MPVYEEKKKREGKTQYYIRTYVKDENGNTKQITRHNKEWLGRNGKFEAQKEENRLRSHGLREEKEQKKRTVTLSELEEEFLEYISKNVDEDTLHANRVLLDHFCQSDKTNQVSTFPNAKVLNITEEMYIKWQKEMVNKKYFRGRQEKPLSIGYLNTIHNVICRMYDFAIHKDYCKINIARLSGKFGTYKEQKMSKKIVDYSTINFEEYVKLLEVSKTNLKYNTYFDLEFSRGVRTGEIRAFRVCDYIPEKKELMVNHTLSKKNVLKSPKTLASKAPIKLTEELNQKIQNLIDILSKQSNFNNQWFIFGGEKPISSHALDYNKDKYFKLAGINKHLRLHDFRHSCATWLFSIGVPITVISKMLRHSSVKETLQTYVHLANEDYNFYLNAIGQIQNSDKGIDILKHNWYNYLCEQDQKQDQVFVH